MTPVKFTSPSDGTAAEPETGITTVADAKIDPQVAQPFNDASTDKGIIDYVTAGNPNHHTEVGTVTVKDVRIDPRVQRPENLRLTRKISRNLVLAALGTVTVSVREHQGPNGDETWYILLDGQQRMIGARKAGYDGPVPARFHFGLSLQEEAELFRLLNDKVDVPAADKYTVGLTEGLEDVVLVQSILDQLGIKLGGNPGQFHAVVVARRLVSMTNGPDAFRWALKAIRDMYPQDEAPKYEGRLVEGLARLRLRDGSKINTSALVTKVLKQGGPIHTLKLGKLKMDTNGTTAMVGVIQAVIQTYNNGLQHDKGNRLEEWGGKK